MRDVVPQRLDDGPVGKPDVLVAGAEEDRAPSGMRRARRLGGEPRLPDPGSPASSTTCRCRPSPSPTRARAPPLPLPRPNIANGRPGPEPGRQREAHALQCSHAPRRPRQARAGPSTRPARSCERVAAPATRRQAHEVRRQDLPPSAAAQSRAPRSPASRSSRPAPTRRPEADPDPDRERRARTPVVAVDPLLDRDRAATASAAPGNVAMIPSPTLFVTCPRYAVTPRQQPVVRPPERFAPSSPRCVRCAAEPTRSVKRIVAVAVRADAGSTTGCLAR